MNELYPYIANENDRIIEFYFNTGKLGFDEIKTKQLFGNNPFIKDTFPIKKPVFPFTSRA